MGDSRTRPVAVGGRLRAARLGCLAAIAVAGWAQGASPRPDNAPRAAPGVVVQYEERASGNVIYLEEKGGMLGSIAPPVDIAEAPPRTGAKAPAKRAAATAAEARLAQRRTTDARKP